MMINQGTQKKVLVTVFLILIIFGLSGWLISEIKPKFLTNTGWFLLLVTIGLIIWRGRHIEKKSTTKRWLGVAVVLCVILIFNYSSCSRKNRIDTLSPKDQKETEQAKNNCLKTPIPAPNPSIVTETDWGRLVRFTAREHKGIAGYKTTRRGDRFKISRIDRQGIIDNVKGQMWPVWGADRYLRGWRKHFLYPNIATPNTVLVLFGKPGNTRIQDIFKFPRNRTEIIVESPRDGAPLILYYHEAMILQNGRYPYYDNNEGYFTFQIEKLN